MACLLYCVSLNSSPPVPALTGVAEQAIQTYEAKDLRVCWSEVVNPETLVEGPSRKAAEAKYRQILRDIVGITTPIAFPFPAIVPDVEAIDPLLAEQQKSYTEALTRLDGLVQYDLTATWEDEAGRDLATPVSGREFARRREAAEARVSAIDAKLKTVTAGIVHEWRSRQERRNRLWFALVPRGEHERFIASLRSAGPSQGVRLRLSGPWPPNEFV